MLTRGVQSMNTFEPRSEPAVQDSEVRCFHQQRITFGDDSLDGLPCLAERSLVCVASVDVQKIDAALLELLGSFSEGRADQSRK